MNEMPDQDALASWIERLSLQRAARQLVRIDEIGRAVAAADADDLSRLLGRRVSGDESDPAFLVVIDRAGPEQDEPLVPMLDGLDG